MKAGNLNNPQSLREHVLVPFLLVMMNITLGIVAYLLHQLYVVQYSDNPMLLSTYNLADNRVWQNAADSLLMWAVLFVVLLIAQLVSIKVRQSMVSVMVLLVSLSILILRFYK